MPSNLNDTPQDLLGTWSLLEYRASVLNSSETDHPMGPDALGMISYAPNGYMSVYLAPSRPKALGRTINDLISYMGRYWVERGSDGDGDGDGNDSGGVVIKHRCEVSSVPELQGSVQTRLATVSPQRLTLTSPVFVDLEGVMEKPELVWRKVT